MSKYKVIDITGQRFGKLVVLQGVKNLKIGGYSRWDCLCDCGEMAIVSSKNLRRGHTKSCGCIRGKGKNCQRGHEYTEWNYPIKSNGKRFCRICNNTSRRILSSKNRVIKAKQQIKLLEKELINNGWKEIRSGGYKISQREDIENLDQTET